MKREQILVDIGALSCDCADHALEYMAKAISGEGGEGPDIWAKHESPFIQSLIELFTSRGLMRIEKVKTELDAWVAGKKHKPSAGAPAQLDMLKPAALKWSPEELELVKIYLQNLPPESFTLSDWGMVVDYLVNRYLPADTLQTEAEWLAVRSSIMGKVQAHVSADVTAHAADMVVAALPLTVEQAQETFHFDDAMRSIMEYGNLRCADQVVQLSESVRHRMKRLILAHQEQVMRGISPPAGALQTQLFDEFAALNRDWRRIAVTEAGENANSGVLASLKPGTKVRRMEQYRGACPFCAKINGTVLEVVDPRAKVKDGALQVWVGKTNTGRSASPRKRVENGLAKRTDAERWWIPAGTVHPHCRGMWHVMESPKPGDDPGFAEWLEKHMPKPVAP